MLLGVESETLVGSPGSERRYAGKKGHCRPNQCRPRRRRYIIVCLRKPNSNWVGARKAVGRSSAVRPTNLGKIDKHACPRHRVYLAVDGVTCG